MMKYESYVMKKSILFFSLITLCISMLSACGGRSASGSDDINPRDTVTVPEGYTGEDSIAYIENAVLKDHISMNDFLELAEVHSCHAPGKPLYEDALCGNKWQCRI